MKLLLVGCDKGAWQIRGRQLGDALDARWTAKPRATDWATAEVIVLVKRAAWTWFQEARAAARRGARLAWDVLDYWAQPASNGRLEAELVADVLRTAEQLRVGRIIGATREMAAALGGVYLPHHHRLGLWPGELRPQVEVVAYEGSPRYLGPWRPALEEACAARGLRFVVNPEDLRHADLVVALRGGEWDGPICRRWKSGVKCVNALVAGRPIITQPCAAFDEIRPVGRAIETEAELGAAIDALSLMPIRVAALEAGVKRHSEFNILRVAEKYRAILRHV